MPIITSKLLLEELNAAMIVCRTARKCLQNSAGVQLI